MQLIRFIPIIPFIVPLFLSAQDVPLPAHAGRDDEPYYTDYRQADFPFIETTLDVRQIAPTGNETNLAPRALVLRLADDVYVGYDTELLRVAAIWTGDFVTPDSMAMLSYAVPLRKLPGGQSQLPRPVGQVRFATDLYPGWQYKSSLDFSDPRPRGPEPRELGRGPLPKADGRWRAIDDGGTAATLHYDLGSTAVAETFSLIRKGNRRFVARSLQMAPLGRTAYCVVAQLDHPVAAVPANLRARGTTLSLREGRYVIAQVDPSTSPQKITLFHALDDKAVPRDLTVPTPPSTADINRAATVAHTRMVGGLPQGAYAVDELALPYPNPWQRRIRPMDLDFLPSGEAVMVTFDGDVFRIDGLDSLDTPDVRLRRIASGLSDPQSIVLRDGEIFVFTRLGIIRLLDLDDDGDTDRYEMFCNDFVQSAETRAFPLSLVALNDGSFLFTIGGQQEVYPTAHAGRTLKVSATGEFEGVYADGLRNAYLSKIGPSDRIVATDQQGVWVPATPMHLIEPGQFYGFEPGTADSREVANVPLWVPHRFAQSGIDLIGVHDARHGGMNGSVIMLDYFKPSLLKILGAFDDTLTQAVAIPIPVKIEVPVIKGGLNPADGQTYYAGMQIWSCHAPRIEGLSRLRTLESADDLPIEARIHREGVWLKFAKPLAAAMTDPSSYAAMSWSYRRTSQYGSGQYRADGNPGIDPWSIHSVWFTPDRRGVFLAIPDLSKVMQFEIEYLRPDGEWQNCLFTINELPPLDSGKITALGLPDFKTLFSAAPAPRSAPDRQPAVSVERGLQLATQYACIACHSLDGSTAGKVGPSWKDIYQTRRPLEDGRRRRANSNYLRQSIMEPSKDIVEGYGGDQEDVAMPSYQGVLDPDEVDSIIMLIESIGPSQDH